MDLMKEGQAQQATNEAHEVMRAYRDTIYNTPWEKASIEQKLEKLRHEMRELGRYLPRRIERLDSQMEGLFSHQHGADGAVLVRVLDRNLNRGEMAAKAQDPLA